jgi:hypothetical protein
MTPKDTVRSELVLRLTPEQIAQIRLRVERRKAAIAAAVAIREIGVVELGDLSDAFVFRTATRDQKNQPISSKR